MIRLRLSDALSIGSVPQNLANETPELVLWHQLAAYGELRKRRIATLPTHKAALAKLAFVGLQQRLLSSIAAFLRTLKAHRRTLQRLVDGEVAQGVSAAAEEFVDGSTTDKSEDLGLEDQNARRRRSTRMTTRLPKRRLLWGRPTQPERRLADGIGRSRRDVGHRGAIRVTARRPGALVDRLDKANLLTGRTE